MSEIGYGRTKDQLLEMVKKLMKKTNRLNPFTDDKPGGGSLRIATLRFL